MQWQQLYCSAFLLSVDALAWTLLQQQRKKDSLEWYVLKKQETTGEIAMCVLVDKDGKPLL